MTFYFAKSSTNTTSQKGNFQWHGVEIKVENLKDNVKSHSLLRKLKYYEDLF